MSVNGPGDVDLQLYLAGALPPGKRILMLWALALDPALRLRLEQARAANAEFQGKEMAALRVRLYPTARTPGAPAPGAISAWASLLRGPAGMGLALASCLALAALAGLPWMSQRGSEAEADFVAKGKALGISLYVKGDTAYRVQSHAAEVSPTDTIQVLPLGHEPQHLVLLGWDTRQGLVRLFPREGAAAPRVSPDRPPPGLLLDGREESRLICVTSVSPFALEKAEALLRGSAYRSMDKAPAARLEKGLYVQVFSISKGKSRPGGRI